MLLGLSEVVEHGGHGGDVACFPEQGQSLPAEAGRIGVLSLMVRYNR
jgi:hypothetical protein